jgi:hypothetical protein
MRNDSRFCSKRRIATGVVAVKMRINDEPQRLVRDSFERLFYLWGEWSELVVHNDYTVLADRHANIPA